MSTKTSFKRIALVAASALAIAGFSAVPANAGAENTFKITASGTASIAATDKAVVGTYVPITLTFVNEDRPVVNLTSTGVGTLAVPTIAAASNTAATTAITATSATIFSSNNASHTPGVDTRGLSTIAGTVSLAFSVTSAVAGVQTVSVVGSSGTSTLTITWGAAAAVSPANSTVYFIETQTGTTAQAIAAAPTTDSTAAVLSTAGTQRGVLVVRVMNDQSPAAGVDGEITSVTVSGPGLVAERKSGTISSGAQVATGAGTGDKTASGGYVAYSVLGSGVSGAATYTVTHTTAKGVTSVLATKVINFYGTTPAKMAAVQNNFVAAANTALPTTSAGAATGSGAFTVTATDSNGNRVGQIAATLTGSATAEGWWAMSSNTACIKSGVASVGAGTGATAVNNAVGVYEIKITGGAAGATSGCSADVEIGYTTSALSLLSAGKFKVSVGGTTISTLALAPTSTSVRPGEKVTLTLTAKDSKGFAVADGDYGIFLAKGSTAAFAGLTSSASLVAAPFAAAAATSPATNDITIVNGAAEGTFFAPYFTGDVILSAKLATSDSLATALDASTLSTTVSVDATDSSSSLALDAANAATDAANNAYDEAQNATQAASDALAAVTALAKQVKSLIASVKKLTAAVAKLR